MAEPDDPASGGPLADAIRGFVSDEQFWFGLEALLAGVGGADG
jgi:hypothetical protein